MSEINKLDNVACPFNPEQYKIEVTTDFTTDFTTKVNHDVAAPTGSFPWAIIKLYLGQKVRRNSWASPYEYIKLTPGSTGSDGKNIPPQIWVIDKDDEQIWAPEQEDMMACDWELAQMLFFDLKVGTGTGRVYESEDIAVWGYFPGNEKIYGKPNPFGTLTNFQNTTEITTFLYFIWYERYVERPLMLIGLSSTPEGFWKMEELLNKDLTVTVDGVSYHLGNSDDTLNDDPQQHKSDRVYSNDDAKKLGAVLEQNVGNTLHFFFKWK
ncbi:DUF2829 domain-containing protein [Xenorhabdus sp. 18]|uniref:Thoeris anti-defense Tad2 family protein n=1 Tax=Xenorhabdus doucetiae TaxID=351671 RepID=UPI001984CAAB|nr:MW1434 family type I TA system toxin [Xenorhabdus sp. 18]MBD2796877.1 DUF2829 domain-containing protein [Xenorhabdus sp. 18]